MEAAMLDNGITVYCDGKTRHLELEKEQAEKFLYYASVASEADSVGGPQRPFPEEEGRRRQRRALSVEEQAGNFKTHLSMLANLNVRQLTYVVAYLDLIENGESWMLETINDLLGEVICEGPVKALECNPRDVLADAAYSLFDWWDNIDTARSQVSDHPQLFPPPATPEPPAAPEPTQPAAKHPAKGKARGEGQKQGSLSATIAHVPPLPPLDKAAARCPCEPRFAWRRAERGTTWLPRWGQPPRHVHQRRSPRHRHLRCSPRPQACR
jgi:hypothetical protein